MEIEQRESKLPQWVQERLSDLRRQVRENADPLRRELAGLRPRVEKLQNRNYALEELLKCAARGGHVGAADIVSALEEYGLIGQQDEPEEPQKAA